MSNQATSPEAVKDSTAAVRSLVAGSSTGRSGQEGFAAVVRQQLCNDEDQRESAVRILLMRRRAVKLSACHLVPRSF